MTAIDPFASVRAPAANSTTNTTAAKLPDDQFGKDTFLKLLVAQLRYQNPMQPQDGSQFLAQTAQFTMVEKLTSLEADTKTQLAANQLLAASGMIGHEIKYQDAQKTDQTGVVTSVKVTADGPVLRINDADVPFASVEEVHAVPVPTTQP
ncbi:MAG: flagellar basal-body rod modification protein FlgD [Actinomycetota bacterium]|jgi:flagellar basal-body rod modification protein FlgD|nr:flagellar basal-body rod modification protein FlgD [Actinomycetota bacterium]